MGSSRNWLRSVRNKVLCRPSRRDIVVGGGTSLDPGRQWRLIKHGEDSGGGTGDIQHGHGRHQPEQAISESSVRSCTKEDEAALRIQAAFRGHLARRAFRALRSLVRLQALARGAYVRKQAQIAQQCMHALVRLQVRVRARQLLGDFDFDGH